jgi:hypothetical protein
VGNLSVGVASLTQVAEQWNVERIRGLAPDPNSAAAGAVLATAGRWSGTGYSPGRQALWGLCEGSGKNPYQTAIDLSGPAFTCSCPSRKFPCKHALALLFQWSSGDVREVGDPAGFAAEWLNKRSGRSGEKSAAPADPKAAAKRVADRAARVRAGLEELDVWLCDRIRTGLSGQERSGHEQLESIAARMIDAQAPGVAARLRRLPAVLASGEGWHSRLLEEFALLRLLVSAHRRLDELPASLAGAVRSHVGYPIARADVLAGPPIRDTWAVLGRRDSVEDRLTARRTWLRAAGSGRVALILDYAPPNVELDGSLLPGTGIAAALHFYPSGIRALVGDRQDEPELLPKVQATSVAGALAEYSRALAADPWTPGWPVLLDAVAPIRAEGRWLVREDDAAALPLAESAGDPWRLLALSGGHPVTLAGEWAPGGLIPLSVVRGQELVPL